MIHTADFKTKTKFSEIKREQPGNYWPIALDIGYSGVKGISPNATYCFPSFAVKTHGEMMVGDLSDDDILYCDCETGEEWRIGASAIETITSDDTNETIDSLYGRNRYYTPMFKVIARAGMAIGMLNNQYGSPVGLTPVLQTGLPPAYMKSDTPLLKDVLSGLHRFKIRVGKSPQWQEFRFELPEENIYVMAQPMGTLFSIVTGINGTTVSDAKKYFNSNVLIFDSGFGTFDVFEIKNRVISRYNSFDDLGMKRILKETADDIYRTYKVEIPVPAMQKYLKDGKIKCFDRVQRITRLAPFDGILERASNKICDEAIEKVMNLYNNLIDHDYLVVTGGTGAAWSEKIRDYFAGMETLTVVSGNKNEDLPHIFSNVRGYYYFLTGKLKKSMAA